MFDSQHPTIFLMCFYYVKTICKQGDFLKAHHSFFIKIITGIIFLLNFNS